MTIYNKNDLYDFKSMALLFTKNNAERPKWLCTECKSAKHRYSGVKIA